MYDPRKPSTDTELTPLTDDEGEKRDEEPSGDAVISERVDEPAPLDELETVLDVEESAEVDKITTPKTIDVQAKISGESPSSEAKPDDLADDASASRDRVDPEETLVADKDGGSGVRRYFMEEAVVVAEDEVDRSSAVADHPIPAPQGRPRESLLIEDDSDEPAVRIPIPTPPENRTRLNAIQRVPALMWMVRGLIVLLIVSAPLLLFILARQQAEASARKQVETVSNDFLDTFTTYNAETLRAQSQKAADLSNATFKEEYEREITESLIADLADAQADSRGEVIQLAIASIEPDTATVLAFVDVTINNNTRSAPLVEKNRFLVTLVKTPDGWRVSDLKSI